MVVVLGKNILYLVAASAFSAKKEDIFLHWNTLVLMLTAAQ